MKLKSLCLSKHGWMWPDLDTGLYGPWREGRRKQTSMKSREKTNEAAFINTHSHLSDLPIVSSRVWEISKHHLVHHLHLHPHHQSSVTFTHLSLNVRSITTKRSSPRSSASWRAPVIDIPQSRLKMVLGVGWCRHWPDSCSLIHLQTETAPSSERVTSPYSTPWHHLFVLQRFHLTVNPTRRHRWWSSDTFFLNTVILHNISKTKTHTTGGGDALGMIKLAEHEQAPGKLQYRKKNWYSTSVSIQKRWRVVMVGLSFKWSWCHIELMLSDRGSSTVTLIRTHSIASIWSPLPPPDPPVAPDNSNLVSTVHIVCDCFSNLGYHYVCLGNLGGPYGAQSCTDRKASVHMITDT